jgi:DNA-binding NtrC family response regulator
MKTCVFNLFIVDDDNLKLTALKNYLDNKFGANINISSFHESEGMLKKIERYTNMVILNCSLKNENSILESMQNINPKTEIVRQASFEDIAREVEFFHYGKTEHSSLVKNVWNILVSLFHKTFINPIRIFVKSFRASKSSVIVERYSA